jgi:hypothetical protein
MLQNSFHTSACTSLKNHANTNLETYRAESSRASISSERVSETKMARDICLSCMRRRVGKLRSGCNGFEEEAKYEH